MKRLNFGLITKIAILIAIVEFITITLMGLIYANKYISTIQTDVQNRLSLINKMFANEELPISSMSRISYMSDMLGKPFKEGFIVGSNGIIIVSSKPEYLGRVINEISGFENKWILEKPSEIFFKDASENTLSSIAYLSSDTSQTPLYHTFITIDISSLNSVKNQIILYTIVGSIILILISTFILIYFAQNFMAKRVNDSLVVLHEVAKGNLDVKINIADYDEMGELQEGINSMIHKVSNLLDEYKQSLKDLETSQEVTLRQKKELNKLNERLQLTIDAVDDGIWDWDLTTDKIYYSKRWKEMLGYKEGELENKSDTFFDFVHEDYKMLVKESLDNHFKDPKNHPFSLEIKLRCKDGSYKWIRSRGKVFLDENKKPIRMLGSHTDITLEKTRETHLKEQHKIIEDQSRLVSMGEMIGNIAHQWRQPLSVITTAASGTKLAEEFGTINAENLTNNMDIILSQAKYLSKTIDDFRDFIRGDKVFKETKVKDILSSTIELTRASLDNNYITLVENIEDDLVINANISELNQALINIISNAKDALKNSNDSDKYIFISTKDIGDRELELKILDSGGGIPIHVIDRIFEPYFTTKHQSVGTGLGLSMTDKILRERHGFSISVENKEFEYNGKKYKGACFYIIFKDSRK